MKEEDFSRFFTPLAPGDGHGRGRLAVRGKVNLRLTLRDCPVKGRGHVGQENSDEPSLDV